MLAFGVCIHTGMQFDGVAGGLGRSGNLVFVRSDEGADEDAFFVHSFDDLCESFFVSYAIESAFGGQLSSFFGNERYLVGDDSLGYFDDGFGQRHFEIQFAGDGLF